MRRKERVNVDVGGPASGKKVANHRPGPSERSLVLVIEKFGLKPPLPNAILPTYHIDHASRLSFLFGELLIAHAEDVEDLPAAAVDLSTVRITGASGTVQSSNPPRSCPRNNKQCSGLCRRLQRSNETP